MKVKLLDLSVLLRALITAERHKGIGHLDADRSLSEMRKLLNKSIYISDEAIESAVYSCKLLEEEGESIQHPDGISTGELIKRLTPKGWQYNEEYSMFEERLRDDDL